MDSLRSTAAAAAALLVVLPFAITGVGDAFGTVPDPTPSQPPAASQPPAESPAPLEAAPAPFGEPQTSVAPAPVPDGAQIPGDG